MRILSIIALILVFASNIVTLVNDVQAVNRFIAADKIALDANNSTLVNLLDNDYITYVFTALTDATGARLMPVDSGSTVPNQPAGAFWAVLNRLLIIGQAIVLILSELGWPAAFFNRYFPVLGKDFGLGALGLMQCL